jgi:glucokinase
MESTGTYAIGIDVGGTKMAIGLVRNDGRLIEAANLPTESVKGQENAALRIRQCIKELLASNHVGISDIRGLGVGCPGPLDLNSGVVLNPYTLPGWENKSLVASLESVIELPVRMENDADAALLGECWVGAGKGRNPVVMLTFGTGVGGSVMNGGKIYRGVDGEHPEIGLMPVFPDMPADYSGVNGSLESLASGSGIAVQGKIFGFKDAASIFEANNMQQPDAVRIVQNAVRAAGIAGWTVAHTFVPECILLGGGLMDYHFEAYASSIRSHLDQANLIRKQSISVFKAALGNQAGVLGAASLWM